MRTFRKSSMPDASPARVAGDRIAATARRTTQALAVFVVIGVSFGGEAATARPSLPNRIVTQTGPALSPRHYERVASPIHTIERTSSEPFGLPTVEAPEGPLVTRWRGVEREIRRDELLLARCATDRSCGSVAALRLMDIVDAARRREGRSRVGEINRAINLAIRPMSDLAQYGVPDLWTAPIQTLTVGAGDCEDYAIAKYVALEEAGVAEEDLRLLVVRDTRRREDHAVVAVRLDGRWLVLDNRWLALAEDVELETYLPMFGMNREGVRRFVAAQPRVFSRAATEPASAALRSQKQPLEHAS
jgi:predicted transglutaminase-like cysteine proteinase